MAIGALTEPLTRPDRNRTRHRVLNCAKEGMIRIFPFRCSYEIGRFNYSAYQAVELAGRAVLMGTCEISGFNGGRRTILFLSIYARHK